MIAAQRAHEATHDPLTGLANRGLFHERASEALGRTGRRSDAVALLFVDLDNFKVINDSLGHAAGDRVLVAVAARLQAAVCAGDLVARFGGDEFTVLLEDLPDGQAASTAARRLAASMHAPVVVEGHELLVSMSSASRSPRRRPPSATCCATPTPRSTAPRRRARRNTSPSARA